MSHAGENQPSYASSRAYVEVLADLPWSRTSADAARERQQNILGQQQQHTGQQLQPKQQQQHPEQQPQHRHLQLPTGAGIGGRGGSAGGAGAALGLATEAAPLSLGQARAVLDQQHYGLSKVKDR